LRVDFSFCKLPQKALAKFGECFSKLNSNPGFIHKTAYINLVPEM